MKGSLIFKGIMGLSLFAIFWAVAWYLPNMNIEILALDFTSMDNSLLNVIRLGIIGISLAFMFWWSTDVV